MSQRKTIRFKETDIVAARRDYTGFCIACGEPRDCCEPDASNYTCQTCDDDTVFGAEEIMIMGLVDWAANEVDAQPKERIHA